MYIDGAVLGVVISIITLLGLFIGAVVKAHSLVVRVQNLEEEMKLFKKKSKEEHEKISSAEKEDIQILTKLHDEEIENIDRRIQYINDELEMLTYSVWACLKQLQKNDSESELLKEAVGRIERHLNAKAHS